MGLLGLLSYQYRAVKAPRAQYGNTSSSLTHFSRFNYHRRLDSAVPLQGTIMSLRTYSVTKRIEFSYGHRLLDYDGICKHPHGHNAVVEVYSALLDERAMVCDFSEIKRTVKTWIDKELDHKMILRHDDPLVEALQRLEEPVYLVDSNPTAEHIAQIIYNYAVAAGLPVAQVRFWETPSSCATYGELVRSHPDELRR